MIEIVSTAGNSGYDLEVDGKRIGLCIQFEQANTLRYWLLALIARITNKGGSDGKAGR